MKKAILLVGIVVGTDGFAPQPLGRPPVRGRTALASVPNPIDTLTSGLASILRINRGITVNDNAAEVTDPPVLKELYDVENSPSCRRVRERITELDLCVDKVIPCAKASKARQELGKNAVIPRLVAQVEGEDVVVEGDEKIIDFLDKQTGISSALSDKAWKQALLEFADFVGGFGASALRMGRGNQVSPAIGPRPEKPVILYDYAGNQFCRLVREVLTELDVPFTLRSTGKGSPRRQELLELTGNSTQCPYLVDPNTGVAMAESAEIVKYLYKTYAQWTPPNEMLRWVSEYVMPLVKPVVQNLAPFQAGMASEKPESYREKMDNVRMQVETEIRSSPVVIYTYGLSPFSTEAKALLESIDVDYKEISLGQEWLPGLIDQGGAEKRAALLEMTGQSSLPHIFVGGESIGGLFSGTPGLLPGLEQHSLLDKIRAAQKGEMFVPLVPEVKVASTAEPVEESSPLFFAFAREADFAEEGIVVEEAPTEAESVTVEETVAQDAIEIEDVVVEEPSAESEVIVEVPTESESVAADESVDQDAVEIDDVIVEEHSAAAEAIVEKPDESESFLVEEAVARDAVEIVAVEEPPAEAEPLVEESSEVESVTAEATIAADVVETEDVVVEGSSAEAEPIVEEISSSSQAASPQLGMAERIEIVRKSASERTKPSSMAMEESENKAGSPVGEDEIASAIIPEETNETPEVKEFAFDPPPTRPPLKPRPAGAVATDPAKAEAAARGLLMRRLAEQKVPSEPATEKVDAAVSEEPENVDEAEKSVVAEAPLPTRPPLKPTPTSASATDPMKAEAVARALLARRLAEEKASSQTTAEEEEPVVSTPPLSTRPPLKSAPATAIAADLTKAEAVARALLARRVAESKVTQGIVLDPPPPTRPPLKPTHPVATVADPVKAEAVARGLLARRLAEKGVKPVSKTVVALGPPPPTRPPLKPVPPTATPSDPAKAEMVARQLLARRLAEKQNLEEVESPEPKAETTSVEELDSSATLTSSSPAEESISIASEEEDLGGDYPEPKTETTSVEELDSPTTLPSRSPSKESFSIASDQDRLGGDSMFDNGMTKTGVFERKQSKTSRRRKRGNQDDDDVSS